MEAALLELGVEYRGISQTAQYTSGAYREQILFAMRERARIDAVLDRYRTLEKGAKGGKKQQKPADAAEVEAAEGSGAAAEDDGSGAGAGAYYPYKPYCTVCGRDLTTVTGYDDETTALSYTCRCGHAETVELRTFDHGKLVWKVDWPMRWAYEGVVFEPSGVDHQSPGSSFVVGGQLVREIFDGEQPIGPMYAFVGISGMAKMSSSKGGVPTPADALQIMEAPLLRWLYARRKPNQSFKVAFDQEIQRTYDEWDALGRKIADGSAQPADLAAHTRASSTALGPLTLTPRPLPYRTLASVTDITGGHEEQTLRILTELDPQHPVHALEEVRPRLDRAHRWITTQVPADQRTPCPRGARCGAAGGAGRGAARVAAAAAGRAGRALVAGGPDVAGLRRAQGARRLRAGREAHPGDEGGPARFLRAALPAAGRPRDRSAAAHLLLLAVGADRVRKLLGA